MAALQYLNSLRNAHPEMADWYSALADLYQKKLWHQLTLKLEEFVAHTVSQVSLFHNSFLCVHIKFPLYARAWARSCFSWTSAYGSHGG